jgi:hypothetical protein
MSFPTRVDSAFAFALIQIVAGVWNPTNYETPLVPLFRLLIFKKEKSDDASYAIAAGIVSGGFAPPVLAVGYGGCRGLHLG